MKLDPKPKKRNKNSNRINNKNKITKNSFITKNSYLKTSLAGTFSEPKIKITIN